MVVSMVGLGAKPTALNIRSLPKAWYSRECEGLIVGLLEIAAAQVLVHLKSPSSDEPSALGQN
jgi:hypothetical protein